MNKNLAAGTTLALALCLASPGGAAADHHQEDEQDIQTLIELMRKDVRAEKADIVAKTLELDAEQAAAFWPIYRKYEVEWTRLGDEQLAIITDYAEHYETLTDEKAGDLVTRSLALEGKEHELRERYLKEFLAVLPAKVVARFFQVERRINNLIDLELSGQIPLAY